MVQYVETYVVRRFNRLCHRLVTYVVAPGGFYCLRDSDYED